jgi:sporulation protein YlmC with PRC-barrel domain
MVTQGASRAGGPASEPMLRRVKDLQHYAIGASDGDVGKVDDIYFDDQSWTVRYVVVDTSGWLLDRHVLISPRAIQKVDPLGQRLVTNLTKAQVEGSPEPGRHRPVSRQYEIDLYDYYGYPYYWAGPYRWGAVAYPYAVPSGVGSVPGGRAVAKEAATRARESNDPQLRSARDVSGHAIEATDGQLGHVEDYLIDDEVWAVRYLIVDPRNWWPGAHVLVSTEWITAVHWNDGTVEVNVSKQAVRDAPTYDPSVGIGRDEEIRYHRHHGRPGYWERHPESWRLRPPAA